ncbi:MAG: DUF4194 domain-containing protein [Gammaproteobacteria bacterium]|nr:MAG: DUF4194 domain-containing protein [Gammaproteobacteria bacterium]
MNHDERTEIPNSVSEGLQDPGLYPGDTGQLPEEARRVLVQLLAGPSLDSKRHGKLWPALRRHEAMIRARLAELFLELVLDDDLEVAFTRQADTGELDTPILLRRAPLTFIQSVLLLYLRQLLTEAAARGERAVVSGSEMVEQMKLYEPRENADRAGFEKRIRAAIEKVKDHSIISPIRASEDRYEISPTLKLLFSADEIAALSRQYAALRDESPEDPADATG